MGQTLPLRNSGAREKAISVDFVFCRDDDGCIPEGNAAYSALIGVAGSDAGVAQG
jgi:hypothetical protein